MGVDGAQGARQDLTKVLLITGIALAVTVGFRQISGLYMVPITQSLGIGVGSFSTAMAMISLMWGIAGIFAGGLADRIGGRRVLLGGIGFVMLGYGVMYAATGIGALTWSGILIGIGVGACGQPVMIGIVGRVASREQRAAAFSKLGIANGIGLFLAVPYTHFFIERLGWQNSLLVVIATLVVVVPLLYLLRDWPAPSAGQRAQSVGEALGEAFALPSYLLLAAGFFICGFHVGIFVVHLPSYVVNLGMASGVAVTALVIIGVVNIAGTYLAGRSVQYLEQRRMLSLIYLLRALVFLGFAVLPKTPIAIVLLSTVLGLVWLATMPLTSGLVATFFGTANLSLLVGIIAFSHQLGSFVGVWAAGALFEATGSYDAIWWMALSLGVLAALLHWPIRERGVARLGAGPA